MIGFLHLVTKVFYKSKYYINSGQIYLTTILSSLFFQLRQNSDFTDITG